MKTRHYHVPVFIPELGCPNRCVFCDQYRITGRWEKPGLAAVKEIIDKHLATIDPSGSMIEIAFFGGNFTGLPPGGQKELLSLAAEYCRKGAAHGIRLSTRPDYINEGAIALLKEFPVTAVELGAQSLDDGVLELAARGHTAADTARASGLVKGAGFSLGLQMMIGLPGDTPEKAEMTARGIVGLGAAETRIYPVLVIKGTALEELCRQGRYRPLTIDEAVEITARVYKIFEAANVDVIKVGLHPSEDLAPGRALAAGPYHPGLRELVMSGLWWDELKSLQSGGTQTLSIRVAPDQVNWAAGYNGVNRRRLEKYGRKVRFISDPGLAGRKFHADLD